MLQAQREAAWGEVARRLAHEIKNPLTPIRLSAERLRHKLLPALTEQGRADCSTARTETIVQQVEAMKEMVNAFSEYARAPRLEMATREPQQAGGRGDGPVPRAGRDPRRDASTVTLDPTLDTVVADPGRLRQLLNNLLTNAVEALEGQDGGVDLGDDAPRDAGGRRGRGDLRRGQRPRLPART